jgi:hypothetical protein
MFAFAKSLSFMNLWQKKFLSNFFGVVFSKKIVRLICDFVKKFYLSLVFSPRRYFNPRIFGIFAH